MDDEQVPAGQPTSTTNGAGQLRPAGGVAGAADPPPLAPTSPIELQSAIDAFLAGVAANVDYDQERILPWRERVAVEMQRIDPSDAGANARMTAALEQLKTEFVATVVARSRYASLLRLWLFTLAAMLVVAAVLSAGGILSWCLGEAGKPPKNALGASLYGHFVGYICFRYVAYGVLLGNALRLSYARSRATFDGTSIETNLLNRPVLNVILGMTIAYLLAALVASGGLTLSVFGFAIKQTLNDANEPGFRDASALLLVGITASIASDIYLQRLIDGARRTANDFLAADKKV